MALCFLLAIIQLLIHLSVYFWSYGIKIIAWYLNQNWRVESRDSLLKIGTGYLKNISSKNSFYGDFMAWFWTIIQLLIRLPAFFWTNDIKMLYGILIEIEGLNQE